MAAIVCVSWILALTSGAMAKCLSGECLAVESDLQSMLQARVIAVDKEEKRNGDEARTCKDISGWVDAGGSDCDGYDFSCQHGEVDWYKVADGPLGFEYYASDDVSALDACCRCGGGEGVVKAKDRPRPTVGSSVKVRDNANDRCPDGIEKVGTVTKDGGYYEPQPYMVDVCNPTLSFSGGWLYPSDVEIAPAEQPAVQTTKEPTVHQWHCGSCTSCLRIGDISPGKCKDNWSKHKCATKGEKWCGSK